MVVLLLAILLLFVAPALLLWFGRLIADRTTSGRTAQIAADALSGQEWFFRPAQPVARRGPVDLSASAAGLASGKWYHRPSEPVFSLPSIDWRRFAFRRGASRLSV